MRKLINLLGLASCLALTASASTVWILDSNSVLYHLDTATAKATQVAGLLNSIVAIASSAGPLYGYSTSNHDLYTIGATGTETLLSATGKVGITALTVDGAGNLWAANTADVFEFSSAGALIGTFAAVLTPDDLEFIGPQLYMTQANVLYKVAVAGGTATLTKVHVSNTLPATTVGLANVPNTLFGFSGTNIYTVNTASGQGAGSTAVTGLVGGGTIIDAAGTPEPATFGIIGLGLLGLGGLAYRRKKA